MGTKTNLPGTQRKGPGSAGEEPLAARPGSDRMAISVSHGRFSARSSRKFMSLIRGLRSRLKNGVMGGMSPPLIEAGRLTVPAFLRTHGYHTAAVGKWHLGMDWPLQPDTVPFDVSAVKGVWITREGVPLSAMNITTVLLRVAAGSERSRRPSSGSRASREAM